MSVQSGLACGNHDVRRGDGGRCGRAGHDTGGDLDSDSAAAAAMSSQPSADCHENKNGLRPNSGTVFRQWGGIYMVGRYLGRQRYGTSGTSTRKSGLGLAVRVLFRGDKDVHLAHSVPSHKEGLAHKTVENRRVYIVQQLVCRPPRDSALARTCVPAPTTSPRLHPHRHHRPRRLAAAPSSLDVLLFVGRVSIRPRLRCASSAVR